VHNSQLHFKSVEVSAVVRGLSVLVWLCSSNMVSARVLQCTSTRQRRRVAHLHSEALPTQNNSRWDHQRRLLAKCEDGSQLLHNVENVNVNDSRLWTVRVSKMWKPIAIASQCWKLHAQLAAKHNDYSSCEMKWIMIKWGWLLSRWQHSLDVRW